MKKFYLLFLFLSAVLYSNATTHTIVVADFSFTPNTLNASCGDTIRWVWLSGVHTTTSATIPSCALSWDDSITGIQTNFSMVIPCAGNYNYICALHPTMIGLIIATCTTGIPELSSFVSEVFPNPVVDLTTISYRNSERLVLYNILGKRLKEIPLSPGDDNVLLDLSSFPKGIYLVSLFREGIAVESRKIVKE